MCTFKGLMFDKICFIQTILILDDVSEILRNQIYVIYDLQV